MHQLLRNFDETIATWVKHIPASLLPFMTAMSFLGHPVVVISLAVISAIGAWVKGYSHVAYAMLATIVALGGNTILKYIFHRTRPETIYVENMKIQSYSFPSGHAFGATVFYGLLAYLAYVHLPSPWNIIVPSVLVVLIFLVGISRVYLGAHFPSDVVMAWILGVISLAIIIKLFKI